MTKNIIPYYFLSFFFFLVGSPLACQNRILPPTISPALFQHLFRNLERSAPSLSLFFFFLSSFLSSTRPIASRVCVKLARQEMTREPEKRMRTLPLTADLTQTRNLGRRGRGLIWLWLGVGAESGIAKDVFWWFLLLLLLFELFLSLPS